MIASRVEVGIFQEHTDRYQFDIGGVSLMSVHRRTYCDDLTWRGSISLADAAQEVFGALRSTGNYWKGRVDVRLLSVHNPRELFELSEGRSNREFGDILRELAPEGNFRGSNIRLLRADVAMVPRCNFGDRTFIVRNYVSDEEGNLVLRLPRRQSVYPSLIGWVINHHQKPMQLGQDEMQLVTDVVNGVLHKR